LEKALPKVSSPGFDAYIAESNKLEQSGTYLDLLRYLNTDEAIRANASLYSVFAGLGVPPDSLGAMYVATWYTRNTYIWSNILRLCKPGDRVVVLFGQGHEYLLREFAQMNPDIRYVDPLTYLR
jgi:hypothetical protein